MDLIPIDFDDPAVRLGVAALGGLAIGIEREWSQRPGEKAVQFAGVRTFILLGLIGGLGAELTRESFVLEGALAFAAAAAIAVVAYARSARSEEPGATTEVSALIVLTAGFLAGIGRVGLASGVIAITVFLLAEKTRIHAFVERLSSPAVLAGARFAVLALVVLPLLPEGPFGPGPGIWPRQLWALVLLFSGLSFLGFLSLHWVGPRRGYGISGVLGGLVSSTLVTLTFARESRRHPEQSAVLALGAVAACTVLIPRLVAILLIISPALAVEVIRSLWCAFVLGLAWIGWSLHRENAPDTSGGPLPSNPLRVVSAMQMAVAFQVVLFIVYWTKERFGSPGLMGSGALLGLTDVDALTYSLVKIDVEAAIAGAVLAVGVLSNTFLKLVLALLFGSPGFRRAVTPGLVLLALGVVAAFGTDLFRGP